MLKTIPYYFYQVDAIESWLDEQAQKGVTVPSSAPTTMPRPKPTIVVQKVGQVFCMIGPKLSYSARNDALALGSTNSSMRGKSARTRTSISTMRPRT